MLSMTAHAAASRRLVLVPAGLKRPDRPDARPIRRFKLETRDPSRFDHLKRMHD